MMVSDLVRDDVRRPDPRAEGPSENLVEFLVESSDAEGHYTFAIATHSAGERTIERRPVGPLDAIRAWLDDALAESDAGAIVLGTLLDEMERRDLATGLVTLCIGAGMGTATIIERV